MTANDLKHIIADCCNDITFTYEGKASGITSVVEDSAPKFQAWHGNDTQEYDCVDDVLHDNFYSGKSLEELSSKVEFEIL